MSLFDVFDPQKDRAEMQITPLLDIIFLILIFYMTLSVFYQLETEISISVPKAQTAAEETRQTGEVIINITKDGTVMINQKQLNHEELRAMLEQVSTLYPNQPVIIRGDQKTYHEDIIRVLDACAGADIWNVSFATHKED